MYIVEAFVACATRFSTPGLLRLHITEIMKSIFILLGIASLSTAVVDPDPPIPWHPKFEGGHPPYIYDRNSITPKSRICEIKSGNLNGDDTTAILEAFQECKEDGHIIFANTTYYIGRAMTTTGLRNVDIELKGTMEWSKDIDYWLNNSLPIGFQNQSTAWLLGGGTYHLECPQSANEVYTTISICFL